MKECTPVSAISLSSEKEEALKEESRRIGMKEAAAWSFMDGFGTRYIAPFAIALGASNKQIGLLNSIPSLVGAFSQLLTLKLMRLWPRKRITQTGIFFQSISWLLIIGVGALYYMGGVHGAIIPNLVIIVYSFLVLCGAFLVPAWTSWMKDIVTKDIGNFFGKRSRLAGSISLTGMLVAGFILDYFKHTHIYIGFVILFFIAFLGRGFSFYFLSKQYEPVFNCDDAAFFSLGAFLKRMSSNNFGRFTIMISLFALATQISSPFMTVYLLTDLKLSYVQFIIVNITSSVAAFLIMPVWGRFSDRYGNMKTIRIVGLIIPVVPVLWIFTPIISHGSTINAVIYLAIIQAFTGLIWAGFDLSAGNFIYDAVTRQRMSICVSYYGILTSVGVLIGTSIGGFISSSKHDILGMKPIFFVFLLSGVARLLVFILLNNKIKEVRKVEEFRMHHVTENIMGLSLMKYLSNFTNNFFKRPY